MPPTSERQPPVATSHIEITWRPPTTPDSAHPPRSQQDERQQSTRPTRSTAAIARRPTSERQPSVATSHIEITWRPPTTPDSAHPPRSQQDERQQSTRPTRSTALIARRQDQPAAQDGTRPIARRPYVEPLIPVSFGSMNVQCIACHAFHWQDERLRNSSGSNPQFSRCCHHGKVKLPALPAPPDGLHRLFTSESSDAKQFRKRIRQYNSALTFTSFTANDKSMTNVNSSGGGPWVWKCGYTIYHQAGGLFPEAGNNPTYAQLYFYDPEEALDYRMHNENNVGVNRDTMEYLQNMLYEINQYKPLFFHAYKILRSTPSRELAIRIVADPKTDLRRYNAPTVDEVAIVISGLNSRAPQPRDIILHRRGGDLSFIHDHHAAYVPLHYVLLFPFGTPGWTYDIPLIYVPQETNNIAKEKHVTQAQYYSFRLHTRDTEFPILQHGGRLFQQYICDVWVSIDQNRLRWIENNQTHLRAALYSGLEDAVGHGEMDVDLHDIGHRVVLPSSYVGGPRYMNQRFQDAITLARFHQGFDLFITFTCNAQWPEITTELFACQTTADRPDLTVRVFNMYKASLIDELTNHNVLGRPVGYVYTIEFQKRGLPHMHLLLALSPDDRPTNAEQVDTIMRATWPDPILEPRLFEIVKRCMVHGPCGLNNPDASCMKDGRCSKGFPKSFQAQTVMNRDGYPNYARPDDGRHYEVRGFLADNRWIVPYNAYLLSRYELRSILQHSNLNPY